MSSSVIVAMTTGSFSSVSTMMRVQPRISGGFSFLFFVFSPSFLL
nr:MAG TPA: hypothetical protein [Caudoviricetes sp.]